MKPTSSRIETRGARAPDPVPLAVAALALLLYLASELYVFSGRLAFPLDDSWIHLQLARQVAAGQGLAFNPGHWVASSSAPLWTALLALVFALPVPTFLGVQLLGGALFLVAVDATSRLARELGLGRGLGRLAATLVASTHWLVWSALSGMEVTLFTALGLWGIVLHLRELPSRRTPARGGLSLPLLAAACLARPEGLLLFAAAVADRLYAARREWRRELAHVAVPLAAALLVLVPTYAFYRAIGDSFLPTTVAVKSNPHPDYLLKGRYLRAVLDVFFRSQPVMLLFAGAGVLRLCERLGTRRDRGFLLSLWLAGPPLVAALLDPGRGPVVVGNFGRYFFPLLPAVAVAGVLGCESLARRLRARARYSLAAALVTLAMLPQAWGLATGVGHYLRTIGDVEASDVAAARWLTELGTLPPDAPLAVQDIGAIKYHLPNPVVDLTGIVNPEILPRLRRKDWQGGILEYLEQRRPAYLVVFPEYYPRLVRAPGFRPLRSFPVPGNVTMAGDELVVFATPWTHDWTEERGAGPP